MLARGRYRGRFLCRSMQAPQQPPRRAQRRRLVLRLALVCAAVFVLAEGALRWLLFSSAMDGSAAAARVRRESKYASSQHEDLHWELRDHFLRKRGEMRLARYDPRLGWTSGHFDAATGEHRDDDPTSGKRPILLFGDSYAAGVTPPEDSFQTLLALSPLGSEFALLNYGVGGYGIDQVLLLMQSALERYSGRDPLVLVGILVDDDLDRCVLNVREQPKPRLELRDGELKLVGEIPTYEARFGDGPPFVVSYLWRGLTRGTQLLPRALNDALTGYGRLDRRKDELGRAIIAQMLRELESRSIEPRFVLFHNLPSIDDPARTGWRDAAVREPLLAGAAKPIDMREWMLAASARTGESPESWFDHVPSRGGHYNARGNQIAFEAIAASLAELAPQLSAKAPLTVRDWSACELRGPQAAADFEARRTAVFPQPSERPRLSLRIGSEGPTELHYALAGRVARFEADALLADQPKQPQASVELSFLADGELLRAVTLRRETPRERIELDLRGRQTFTVRASDAGDGIAGDWIALAQPRFE